MGWFRQGASKMAGKLLGVGDVGRHEAFRRLSICRACRRFEARDQTCKECGCYMEEKVRFSHIRSPSGDRPNVCPKGKW